MAELFNELVERYRIDPRQFKLLAPGKIKSYPSIVIVKFSD